MAHQPEFLPWLGFVSKASMGDCYLLWDTDQFKKETFQNRNRIRSKGPLDSLLLTVPVKATKKHLIPLNEVEIHQDNRWQRKLLQSVYQSYSKTPFFDKYYPLLESIINQSHTNLRDLNVSVIKWVFDAFDIEVPLYTVSGLNVEGYHLQGNSNDAIISMCRIFKANVFVFGRSGRDYIDYSKFQNAEIQPVFQDFHHPVYSQIHGEFLPNMSSIDLLFNHGSRAVEILGNSTFL